MKKSIIPFLFVIFLLHHLAYTQDNYKTFEISLPNESVSYSSYRTIDLVDARADTTQFGSVQTGAFNRKAKVITQIPLAYQLGQVMNAITDRSAGQGELLLELRQFRFAEITAATSEKGFCNLRANLYTKESDAYYLLASIDTLIIFKSIDVTSGLLREASKAFTDFLVKNLVNRNYGEISYTLAEIRDMKNIEKQSIPLYQTTSYTDGFYKTYNSFKMQVPDAQMQVKKDNFGDIKFVKVKDESGDFNKIKSQDAYAVVYNGQAFIATKFGYYPLIKKDNELYFQGKTDLAASRGNAAMATALFGIAGAAIASASHSIFEMRIDHLTGEFFPVRPIRK